LIGAGSMMVGIPILLSREYRRQRIFSFLGIGDNLDVGYQANQSLISLGNGGVFGVGLGNSIEKNHFLPTPHTDFIFAIIGEELGYVLGTVPVLTLFLYIFLRGLNISKNCTDPFGVLLSVGIAFNLVLYAFVNAAVVTGLFPVTGLPMPMVSYGGSGMVINMALIGILLNISQSRKSIGAKNRWSPRTYG
jgi:cell division protein FtsW